MTIKELAHAAQKHLQSSIGFSFKKAHTYELLAASFGFKSYAAFKADTVFTTFREAENPILPNTTGQSQRYIELGYPSNTATLALSALQFFLAEQRIGAVKISGLIDSIREEFSVHLEGLNVSDAPPFDFCDPDWANTLLLDGLKNASDKGNANAHYALALIYWPDDEYDQDSGINSYWYEQAQKGRTLGPTEKQWADEYEASLNQARKHEFHLREAGQRGNPLALLGMAEHYGDMTFFELGLSEIDAEPIDVAAIAEQIGHTVGTKHWLTIAAEQGNTDAMLQLIEDYDGSDLNRCWTWMYLSQLLGTDLSQSGHYAIHEDGSLYDDDVGGPMFVGGRDAVTLDPISSEQASHARLSAQNLFERIQRQGH